MVSCAFFHVGGILFGAARLNSRRKEMEPSHSPMRQKHLYTTVNDDYNVQNHEYIR